MCKNECKLWLLMLNLQGYIFYTSCINSMSVLTHGLSEWRSGKIDVRN
jgi:hypothetical protein